MTTKAQLQAEREFLLARAAEAGSVRFVADRWTGTSSNALSRFAFGGDPPGKREYPLDPSDLAACYRTLRRLPSHLHSPAVIRLLNRYRASVKRRYDLAEMDQMLALEGKGG